MSLKDLLEAETKRLGFTISGVAPAAPPTHLSTYLRWIESGLHASMQYLAEPRALNRRTDPRRIEPQALSLLVVALRYFNPLSAPEGPPGEALGRVAAYAWGADYHDIIPPLLNQLVELLEKELGRPLRSRSYTDTGPVLERDFAQAPGLGWSGKNTCLISPRHGSYFLLGETLLDAPLEHSEPLRTDHCGTCRRCIEACPTDAIREDRTIDSHRCISYQTIENKGSIPPELRPGVGDWVFGCDICQAVCPWNLRFAQADGHPALAPRPGVPRPVLREELRLTPQSFNQKFRGSPVKRAKRRGYLRNVAIALGNSADSAAVPDLAETLHHEPEPLVRAHAAWALGRIRTLRARLALDRAHREEQDPQVVAEIRSALEE